MASRGVMEQRHEEEDTQRLRLASVPVDVLEVEPVRQVEVRLHGRALPGPPNSIADFQVDLRSVKRPPTFVHLQKKGKHAAGTPGTIQRIK